MERLSPALVDSTDDVLDDPLEHLFLALVDSADDLLRAYAIALTELQERVAASLHGWGAEPGTRQRQSLCV